MTPLPSNSAWWIIETFESYNGSRSTGQGNFTQWFSPMLPFVRRTLLALALSLLSPAQAADFSTTNSQTGLRHFWKVVEEAKRPVTVLSFGDSMADSYRSMTSVFMNRFVGRLGTAGYSLNNYLNTLGIASSGDVQNLWEDQFWYTHHLQVGPGGAVWWAKEWGTGVLCDRMGVFYVSQPQGGLFTVSVATNGGPWGMLMTADGHSDSPAGHFLKLDLALDIHMVRVDTLAGTNIIIGAQAVNTKSSGVHVSFTDRGGISLAQVTNVPLAIRIPIIQALAPDLIIWHMKENGGEPLREGLLECDRWWSSAAPDCDVLYVGTPWVSEDAINPVTIDQNTIVREIATSHDRAYVDCMTPAVSYDWMVQQAYMADVTHENLTGNTYLATIAWDDLGWFALRAPRGLSVRFAEDHVTLEHGTAPGIWYSLEAANGFSNWLPISTVYGNGSPFSTNFPSGPDQFFRLRLRPDAN